jgi:putative endonuclease
VCVNAKSRLQRLISLGCCVNKKAWCIYIVECSDGTYYTGISNDVDRRILEHNYGSRSAKYTRSRRPVQLRYIEYSKNRSTASKREYQIKKFKRSAKFELFKGNQNELTK